MDNYWWCILLFRVLLPSSIIVAAARPTITSYIYLLMGFYLPFFSVPTHLTMVRKTGTYMKLLVIVCILICSCVVSFYFALFFPKGEEYDMAPCSTLERVLRTVGIIEFQGLPLEDTIAWCLPEPLMLVTSLFVYFAVKRLTSQPSDMIGGEEIEEAIMAEQLNRKKLLAMILNCGKYLVVFIFCVAAVIRPSAIGGVYYCVFLVVLTYWACNKTLGKVYARILVGLLPIVSLHLTAIFFYQMQYFQEKESIRPETLYGRLFQLVKLNTFKDCEDPRLFKLQEQRSSTQAFPYVLFLLYYLTALVSREILQAKPGLKSLIVAFFRRETVTDYESRWKLAFKKVRASPAPMLAWDAANMGFISQQKIEDDKIYAIDERLLADRIKRMIERAIQFIIRISYLVANFMMMIWAITYVGWKTLILLIWANLIWLLPGRRKIMLVTSPFLVIYVWFLLTTSYVFSMDIALPDTWRIVNLDSDSYPGEDGWIHLLIISLFSIIIVIPMRQLFQERALKREQRSLADAMGITTAEATTDLNIQETKSKTWVKIQNIVMKWISLCWIWVVVITMIWMDFMSATNPFRITFVGLAIVLVMTFQIFPFNCWKKFLLVYWWIVITYAMINLFVVYMYQLHMTRKLFHKYVLSEETFTRFGFTVIVNTKDRMIFLANPLFFQIAIVIQQNYLQQDFNKFTSPESPEELAVQEQELEEIDSRIKKLVVWCTNVKNVFFVLLEIHLQKIAVFIGWLLCCLDWCAMFLPFVFLLTASCIFGRLFTFFTIQLMAFFVELLILARLIYMNQYRDHHIWDYVGYYERNGQTYNVTLNTADWLGFHESNDPKQADFWNLAWCFIFVFIVTLDPVVRIRQRNYRKSRNMSTSRQRILFPEINHINCHDSTKNMLKFLLNYGFFKIGIELTAITAVIVVAIRMDSVAIVLAIGLLTTYSLNRKWTERVFMPYMLIVGVWLPIQYIMNLGCWPTYWEYSRTRFWNQDDVNVRTQQFLHILNMAHPPPRGKIVYDFLLLLCLSRQWRTFRVTRRFKGQEFGGGSNESVAHLIDSNIENPIPDFVTYSRNFLDVYKKIIFTSWFYISLLMTFLAGVLSPNIYSFGYILAAFVLMWEGTDMFLRPPKQIIFRWNMLILYNLSILVFRTISQIFGCVLVYKWKLNCKIFSMFNIACIDRFDMFNNIPNMRQESSCAVSYDVIGLKWDCICFFFLIIQQRIFKSFYFFHIVNDAKAQTILANQGAILIETERQKKRKAYDNTDEFIKANIKTKLQRIQANRLRIQGDVYLKRKQNHKHMLRSGDYYLFDELESTLDVSLLPPKQEYVDTEFDPYDPMNLEEYISLFIKSDLTTVLNERTRRKQQKQAAIEGKKVEDLNNAVALKTFSTPSSSKDPDITLQSGTTTVRNLMNVFLFLLGLFEGLIVTITAVFNRSTKDFRFILNEMDKERTLLKERTNYKQGIRIGSKKIWHSSESYGDFFKSVEGQKVEEAKIKYSIYEKLLRSIWYLGLSQSEWVCYLVIILNQVTRANFISLPLPLMVFCWGSLTVPKPTKTFWVINIAYTLVMSIIKNFFVMEIADWNEHTFPENPFYPPTVIGIDRYINSLINLSLLCVIFFHRVILQWLGLWEPFTYRTATLIKDGFYNFKDGNLIPLKENETVVRNNLGVRSIEITMGDYFPRSIRHGTELATAREVHGIFGLLHVISGGWGMFYFWAGEVIRASLFILALWERLAPSLSCILTSLESIWARKYAEGFRLFIQQLISPSSTQIPVDVYTPMFLCDFMNLLLLVFFYSYFESTDSDQMGFVQYVQDNRVPVTYIGIIVMYSVMIVIDRWIYLRKNRFAKLVYHFFHVMLTHIWAFVLYPMLTARVFSATFVVQLFYVFKCLYFLFSAYQIRNGYPRLISSHFLTHGTSLYHRFGFMFYRMIPYLFEMRTLLDWTCVDTSLGVSDFFKMEEIMQSIFDQKCQQDFDAMLYDSGGKRKNRTKKYLVGGFLFAILFLTIIFPFFIFSLGGSVGVKTHPAKLNLELYMGSAEPIFNSYASQKNLMTLTQSEFKNLTRTFNNIRESEALFGAFKAEDVVVVKWSSHSLSSWLISPGSLKELIEEMKSQTPFGVRMVIRYTHVGSGGDKSDRVFGQNTFIPPLPNEGRRRLLDMLTDNDSTGVVWLPLVFPKFLMITKESKPKALPIMEEPSENKYIFQTENEKFDDDAEDDDANEERNPKRLRNLLLSLQKENGQFWWQIKEECDTDDDNFMYYLKDLVHNSCENLVMYTFNEKVFSGTMHYVTGSGIMGLYFIYFMVVFGVLRSCMVGLSEIWIEDLPNADRILRKCKELYVARDMQDFELEEELFSELIFIMRSREICIKLSRYQDDPYNPSYTTPGTRRAKS